MTREDGTVSPDCGRAAEGRDEGAGQGVGDAAAAGIGMGSKRISAELGCSRNTVRHWLARGDWRPCASALRSKKLDGLCERLRECFRRHGGNADVVRQELARGEECLGEPAHGGACGDRPGRSQSAPVIFSARIVPFPCPTFTVTPRSSSGPNSCWSRTRVSFIRRRSGVVTPFTAKQRAAITRTGNGPSACRRTSIASRGNSLRRNTGLG